ncbi:MAG: pilus assembly protein TadG-related protein, partial [Pseudomonadota bacterium]
MRRTTRRSQQGAVIVTVALLLLLLLGFVGFAMDFGRLFIVKSELQTAMDSCALAAAQELDLQPSAVDRARSAGLTAGNLNRVNFQSASWSGQGQLVNADITFRDPSYVATANHVVDRIFVHQARTRD